MFMRLLPQPSTAGSTIPFFVIATAQSASKALPLSRSILWRIMYQESEEGGRFAHPDKAYLSQSICCLLKTRVYLEKNICCKLVYTGCKTSPSDGIFTEIGTLLSLLRLNNRIVHLPINVVKMDFQRVDGAVLEAISTTEPTIHTQFQLLPI